LADISILHIWLLRNDLYNNNDYVSEVPVA
jgi:hypothetical protein